MKNTSEFIMLIPARGRLENFKSNVSSLNYYLFIWDEFAFDDVGTERI